MEAIQSFVPKYTVEDYEQWEGEWELWNGVPVAMSPSPIRDHQITIRNLLILIQRQLWEQDGCHCQAISDIDWRISSDSVFRPDVVVVCQESEIADYIEQTPRLVIEVWSDSTRQIDEHQKRLAYAALGVEHYVMVDHWSRKLLPLRLVDGEYVESGPECEIEAGCVVRLEDSQVWRGLRKVRRL